MEALCSRGALVFASVFPAIRDGNLTKGFLAFAVFMSLVSLTLYGIDKYRAVHNRRRIPEKILLLSALLGGAGGALAGMLVVRHKTRKWKFRILVV